MSRPITETAHDIIEQIDAAAIQELALNALESNASEDATIEMIIDVLDAVTPFTGVVEGITDLVIPMIVRPVVHAVWVDPTVAKANRERRRNERQRKKAERRARPSVRITE